MTSLMMIKDESSFQQKSPKKSSVSKLKSKTYRKKREGFRIGGRRKALNDITNKNKKFIQPAAASSQKNKNLPKQEYGKCIEAQKDFNLDITEDHDHSKCIEANEASISRFEIEDDFPPDRNGIPFLLEEIQVPASPQYCLELEYADEFRTTLWLDNPFKQMPLFDELMEFDPEEEDDAYL